MYNEQNYTVSYEVIVKGKTQYKAKKIKNLTYDEIDELNKDDVDYEIELDQFGYLDSVYGCYSDIVVDSYETALYSLYSVKEQLGITNPFKELSVKSVLLDETGYIFKFNQMYNGMEVYNRGITVSADPNGVVDYLLSNYYPITDEVNTTINCTDEQIMENLSLSGYTDCSRSNDNLMILNYYGNCRPVWGYIGTNEEGTNRILVDAITGSVDYCVPATAGFFTKEYQTSGEDMNGEEQTFDVTKYTLTGTTFLESKKRNIIVEGDKTGIGMSEDNIWNKDFWTREEVTIMSSVQKVYDYYLSTFKRNGQNGAQDKNGVNRLTVTYNYPENFYLNKKGKDIYENNCYGSLGVIEIGNGKSKVKVKVDGKYKTVDSGYKDGLMANSLDVIAHEYTHGIVEDETNLIYFGYQGSINEAYADIMACFMTDDWLIGEELVDSKKCIAIRSLIDPKKTGCTYACEQVFWKREDEGSKDDDYDNGHIHNNSTVISHVAYLMEQDDLSIDNEKVWYKSLCMGYDDSADFYDVRKNIIKAAKKLGASGSELEKIRKRFNEAAITEQSWYHFSFMDNLIYSMPTEFEKFSLKTIELSSSGENCIPVSEVKIENENHDDIQYTDKDGWCTLTLTNPCSVLDISKEGYVSEKYYYMPSKRMYTDFSNQIELIPGNGNSENCIIEGYIKEKNNIYNKSGVELLVRRGINNIYGEPDEIIETEENGYYRTPCLKPGHYCIEVIGENFKNKEFFNVVAISPSDYEQYNVESLQNYEIVDIDHIKSVSVVYSYGKVDQGALEVINTIKYQGYVGPFITADTQKVMYKIYINHSSRPAYSIHMINTSGKRWKSFIYSKSKISILNTRDDN